MKKSVRIVLFELVCCLLFCITASAAHAYSVSIDKTEAASGDCLKLTWSGFGDTTNIMVYKGSDFWLYANTQASYQGTQDICINDEWEKRQDYKIRVAEKVNYVIYVDSKTFSVIGPKPQIFDFSINGGNDTTSSRSVTLQNNYIPADPPATHYMASENASFSGTSWQSYSATPLFTLSDGAGTKTVYLKLKNKWGESASKSDSIYYSPPTTTQYYSISGHVQDADNQGISQVTLSGFPSGSVTTDSNGNYSAGNIVSGWSGTITPSKDGYSFSPANRTYSGLAANLTNQNFTAAQDIVGTCNWQTGEWSACIDTCDGWQKNRTVECADSDGQAVDDSHCTSSKPNATSNDCPDNGASRLNSQMNGERYVLP